MQEELLKRAEVLLSQNRNSDANKLLADLYSQDPNNVEILSLYCQVSINLNELKKAEDLIDSALSIEPNNDYLYYQKANIALQNDQYDRADFLLSKAIEINPYFSHYFAMLGNLALARKQFEKALDFADKALELDATDVLALNIRSTAQLKLNKKEASFETIEDALEEDPNNPYTHSNFGWNLLEKGNHEKALFHFQEALKTDPNFEYAQDGMKEALKAKYYIYRKYLQFSLWLNNFTAKYQWGYIIGFYLLYRFVAKTAQKNEALQAYLYPLLALMFIFAMSTWLITPFSNLFFRLNKFGKHLLDKKEKMSSNFVGFSFVLFIIALITYLVTFSEFWLLLAFYGFTMMIPYSVMFMNSKIKHALLIYTIAMAGIGAIALSLTYISNGATNIFSMIYIFGFIAFQWLANFIMIKESNI